MTRLTQGGNSPGDNTSWEYEQVNFAGPGEKKRRGEDAGRFSRRAII